MGPRAARNWFLVAAQPHPQLFSKTILRAATQPQFRLSKKPAKMRVTRNRIRNFSKINLSHHN
jgi:hypothetical protein